MSQSDNGQHLFPVPETREAFDWLGSFGDGDLETSLMRMSSRVRQIAPECVALSLSVLDGDLTFTVQSNRPGASLLDAVQYLDGGPCLEALEMREPRHTTALDEHGWQMFAQAEALVGISSTLSFPILAEQRVVGGVNLYGATSDAFDGRREALAEACGAWAEGAVTNADLGFESRIRAAATPGRLLDSADVNVASGLLAEVSGLSLGEAGQRIRRAAVQAGVSESELARFLLDAHGRDIERDDSADAR